MKRALFLTYSKFKDHELVYPYYRLMEDGFDVHVVADKKDAKNRVYGIHGVNMPVDSLISDFIKNTQYYFDNFDLLIIPGGGDNTEYLRMVPEVQKFIHEWDAQGKTLSFICHAPQVIISAGIANGRKMTGFYTIKHDIINSGAEYIDAPVVVDRNLISSPHYDDMSIWMKKTLEVYYNAIK